MSAPLLCDWWLESRRKCRSRATIAAIDEHGAPFYYCARHWPLAQTYIPVRLPAERTEFAPTPKDRTKAVAAVQVALKAGRITRTPCEDCGASSVVQAHHYKGYAPEHRLEVIWLCRPCHLVRHGKRSRVPSWERGARAYAEATGRHVGIYKADGWHGFGDWSMPKHLLKTMRHLWAALRTDEERAAMLALIDELRASDVAA